MNLRSHNTSTSTSTHVLVIAPEPFYEDRGTPISVRYLIEGLIRDGAQVDLVTYPSGEPIECPRLRIFRIPNLFRIKQVPIGFSYKKVLLDIVLTISVLWRLTQKSYDYIHAVEEAVFVAILAGKLHRIPLIYDMQSSLPEQLSGHFLFRIPFIQRWLQFCERWVIHRVDSVVCSAGLGAHVRNIDSSVPVVEWRFPSLSTKVSTEEVKKLGEKYNITSASPIVLYTGNFAPYQDLPLLIEAAFEINTCFPNIQFVFVGGTESEGVSLSPKAKILHKQGALKFISRQPRTMMSLFLSMADVVVSPRMSAENLPLKIFDYLASGRPIVAIDSPTNRAVLASDRALLVGPSVSDLKEGILRLLKDREYAESLGKKAKTFAKEHNGWNAFMKLIYELYNRGPRKTGGRKASSGHSPFSSSSSI